MASGTFYLEEAYDSKSPNCVEAYVEWSSVNTSGSNHTVTMALYAARIDYSGSTSIQYTAPSGSGWTRTYTNSSLVFSGGSYVHICTVETTVTSNSNGVASFSGASFYAGFYSSSYGTRRMSGTITSLTLDKPKVAVTVKVSKPTGINIYVDKSSYYVGDTVTFTIKIADTAKYSSYKITNCTGATLVSGTTYKITGNVVLYVTGYLKTYNLYINSSAGVSVTVSVAASNGTVWKTCTASTNNALPYSYIATISISIAEGYEFVGLTVNGTAYTESDTPSISITGDMTIDVSARESGVVYIRDSSGINRYQVYIYTSTGWNLYKPMLYTSSGWGVCN